MPRVKDPVCGMMIDSESAAAHSDFDGRRFFFCSSDDKREFDLDPAQYAGNDAPLRAYEPEGREKHEPPYTVSKSGWTSPKFGSAGSGGGEYDLLPEAHEGSDPRP